MSVPERARLFVKVTGLRNAQIPLKAVVFSEVKDHIKILAEVLCKKEEFEVDLKALPKDLPESAVLTIVPEEMKSTILIRRIAESGLVPAVTFKRESIVQQGGRLMAADLPLKAIDENLLVLFKKRRVSGRVIRRNPETGKVCPVPGANVHVMDVDVNFFWWHPYSEMPWVWLYPYFTRREELALTKTDVNGNFSVDIPLIDIDAIVRWRLRYRCLWDNIRLPRVIDAINVGIKPDLRFYPELLHLPELYPKPKPPVPDPGPIHFEPLIPGPIRDIPTRLDVINDLKLAKGEFFSKVKYEATRNALSERQEFFGLQVPGAKFPVLEQPAFPRSIEPPALPDEETLYRAVHDKRLAQRLRKIRPMVRLIHCWKEIVPEFKLHFDIPDIVFKVEQEVDGVLNTIYEDGFFDINWNLSEPTDNIVLEANDKAICVGTTGNDYTPCTGTGFVGVNDMPIASQYLNNEGYAIRVNRPKSEGVRPPAETPFCGNLRLTGCPGYGQASYYRVLFSLDGGPESVFNEIWHMFNYATGIVHKVQPDSNGYYKILTPQQDYYPYHTLLNWRTNYYPNGRYTVRLELYNANYGLITNDLPPVTLVIDNSAPDRVEFSSLRWRVVGGQWSAPVSLSCPIIKRPQNKDIEMEVQYNVSAHHFRDLVLSLGGCAGGVGSYTYWHTSVDDNNRSSTWTVTLPAAKPQGAYGFYLEGRSRAFNAMGGLFADWYIDPFYIWRGNHLRIVILDE